MALVVVVTEVVVVTDSVTSVLPAVGDTVPPGPHPTIEIPRATTAIATLAFGGLILPPVWTSPVSLSTRLHPA